MPFDLRAERKSTMHLNTYLCFNGDCEAAFHFYEHVFGATIECLLRHEGTPAEAQTPPDWRKKVLHARLSLNGQMLMASDAPPACYEQPKGFSVNINVKDPAEAERVFGALAEGGQVRMPIGETFWAERFGMVVDRFGIPWMVNCEGSHAAV
jgi:PhnB protein